MEKLVSLLKKIKAPLSLEYQALAREYESYVKFCESISMPAQDIQSVQGHDDFVGPKGLAGVVEETQSKDVLDEIRITFGHIERLRDLERTLKDLDGLIDLLSKVGERFTGVAKQKGQDLRLFISSTGKGLSFRLVYGRGTQQRAQQSQKAVENQEVSFDGGSVENWLEYGMRAVLGKTARNETAP